MSVILTEGPQLELSQIAQHALCPPDMSPWPLILMLAESYSRSTIKQGLGTAAPTTWKQRFLAVAIDALDTAIPGIRFRYHPEAAGAGSPGHPPRKE